MVSVTGWEIGRTEVLQLVLFSFRAPHSVRSR